MNNVLKFSWINREERTGKLMTRRLKMGMVGGGRDALIGNVHRMAARLDDGIELMAGAFSSNPEKARRSGEDLFLDPKRIYPD